MIGGILLGVSPLGWAVRTLYLLGRERRWSWKVAAVPVVVVAGLLAGLIFRPASFGAVRPEMEEVAVGMLREDAPNTRQGLSLGGTDISSVHRESDGGSTSMTPTVSWVPLSEAGSTRPALSRWAVARAGSNGCPEIGYSFVFDID